jgi:hypothetical protein
MRASLVLLLATGIVACGDPAREPLDRVVAVDAESVLLASRDGRVCRLAWRTGTWAWCDGGGANDVSLPVVVVDAVAQIRDKQLVVLDLATGTRRLSAPSGSTSPPTSITTEAGPGDRHRLV